MAQRSNKTVGKTFAALSDYLSRRDLISAVERAGRDKRLLRQAKADPKAFLKGQGVTVPPRTEITITQARPIIVGQIRLCVRVCRVIGRFVICATICITIIVIAA